MSLSVFAEQYSPEEMARIAQIQAKHADGVNGRDAEAEYIRVIREEAQRPTAEQIAQADDDQLRAFAERLRRQKSRS